MLGRVISKKMGLKGARARIFTCLSLENFGPRWSMSAVGISISWLDRLKMRHFNDKSTCSFQETDI